jgi:ABC-type sugar transport system ATPase subunit
MSFSGVTVLSDVAWELSRGTTLGLVGENGAGKSTLMKIVAGIHPVGSYGGEVEIAGERAAFAHPRDALRAGVVYVPQELMFSPGLSLEENMFAGRLPRRMGIAVDRDRLHRLAADALAGFGVEADPRRLAGEFSPATQRLAMIAAALSESAKLLILDEPTASLTEPESERLFEHVATLHARGVSCIHITHRLDEVEQYADRVVVLRNGRVAAQLEEARGNRPEMIRAMIGRDPSTVVHRQPGKRHDRVLSVRELRVWEGRHTDSLPRVDGVDFDLHGGEILGIYGLVGAGRTEMAKALFGAWSGRVEGTVQLGDRPGRPASPRHAMSEGIAMLPEDRKVNGIIAGQSVRNNMSASSITGISRGGVLNRVAEEQRNRAYIEDLDVRPPRLDVNIETLSGGNQQKVLLARCLAAHPSVLILDEPTVGVDVGARFEIFRIIRELTDSSRGVLLISSDIAEVTTESDRILVMYKGRITGEFGPDATRAELMAAATGVRQA